MTLASRASRAVLKHVVPQLPVGMQPRRWRCTRGHCPGQKPPFFVVKRLVRPCKSAIQNPIYFGKRYIKDILVYKGRLNAPGRPSGQVALEREPRVVAVEPPARVDRARPPAVYVRRQLRGRPVVERFR
jgi:hypothetical protein